MKLIIFNQLFEIMFEHMEDFVFDLKSLPGNRAKQLTLDATFIDHTHRMRNKEPANKSFSIFISAI